MLYGTPDLFFLLFSPSSRSRCHLWSSSPSFFSMSSHRLPSRSTLSCSRGKKKITRISTWTLHSLPQAHQVVQRQCTRQQNSTPKFRRESKRAGVGKFSGKIHPPPARGNPQTDCFRPEKIFRGEGGTHDANALYAGLFASKTDMPVPSGSVGRQVCCRCLGGTT